MTEDLDGPYGKAAYLGKLKESRTMSLKDLDGTMTDGPEPTDRELSDRARVRRLENDRGVVSGAVTARTANLTLSKAMLEASPELLDVENIPNWGKDQNGKHYFVPLEEVPHFAHCLDFDFTASFGSHIIVKNGSGYKVDRDYAIKLESDYCRGEKNSDPWRFAMMSLLNSFPETKDHLSDIESIFNYEYGKTNVAPLKFRFQLDFYGSAGLEKMQMLQAKLEEERTTGNPLAIRVAMQDESRIDENDPEKSRYTLYLLPWQAPKPNMINRIVERSAQAAGIPEESLRLFYAGDTMTDLRAGLWAGRKASLHFLLPTGSRLAPYIINRRSRYGNEDLSFLWGKEGNTQLQSRLVKRASFGSGMYQFVHKWRKGLQNTVVIGDERYPGMTAPGSVAAFLEEFLPK